MCSSFLCASLIILVMETAREAVMRLPDGVSIGDQLPIDGPDEPLVVPVAQLLQVLFVFFIRARRIITERVCLRVLAPIGALGNRIHVILCLAHGLVSSLAKARAWLSR